MRLGRHGVFVAMAAVAAVSFALCAWLTEVSQPWAFYFSPLRAWEFAFGGLASMALLNNWAARSRYLPVIGWLGLALIAAAYLTVSDETPFPGFIALAPAAGAVMVLLSGVRQSRIAPGAVAGAAARSMGREAVLFALSLALAGYRLRNDAGAGPHGHASPAACWC